MGIVPTNVLGELKTSTSKGKCSWRLRSGLVFGWDHAFAVENKF